MFSNSKQRVDRNRIHRFDVSRRKKYLISMFYVGTRSEATWLERIMLIFRAQPIQIRCSAYDHTTSLDSSISGFVWVDALCRRHALRPG